MLWCCGGLVGGMGLVGVVLVVGGTGRRCGGMG